MPAWQPIQRRYISEEQRCPDCCGILKQPVSRMGQALQNICYPVRERESQSCASHPSESSSPSASATAMHCSCQTRNLPSTLASALSSGASSSAASAICYRFILRRVGRRKHSAFSALLVRPSRPFAHSASSSARTALLHLEGGLRARDQKLRRRQKPRHPSPWDPQTRFAPAQVRKPRRDVPQRTDETQASRKLHLTLARMAAPFRRTSRRKQGIQLTTVEALTVDRRL